MHVRISLVCVLFGIFLSNVSMVRADEATLYKPYASVLTNFVLTDGRVDYASLKQKRAELDSFLKSLASFSPKELESLDRNAQIAFWINAYNAITLGEIINHYPIKPNLVTSLLYPKKSIRQIDNVWDAEGHTVVGRKLSLNDIEHRILRQEFKKPEIHVALVCAARSCPPLRNEPYYGDLLVEQFRAQAKEFVESGRGISALPERGVVYVSKIFEWFGDDFVSDYSGNPKLKGYSAKNAATLAFLLDYLDEDTQQFIFEKKPNVEYLDYDWTLNDL